jgi:competence protein ComEA
MRKSHFVLSLVILVTLCASAFAAETPSSSTPSGVININTADASQLANLPRIGAKAAQRIVDYRKEHGAFAKTTDLMQVKGIGEKSFESLRPYLAVDGKTTLAGKVHSARKPRASRSSKSRTQLPTSAASK